MNDEVVSASEFSERVETYDRFMPEDNVTEPYRQFRDAEGIPVHTGLYVEDITEVETGPWDRTGQEGAFVNLYGSEGINDIHVHLLQPAGETTVQHHDFDELVYVAQGNGITEIGTGKEQATFEWDTHSVFCLPANTPYRHLNVSEDQPARLVAATTLPLRLQMDRSPRHVFGSDYDFWADAGDDDFFSADGTLYSGEYTKKEFYKFRDFTTYWEANFIPDALRFDKIGDAAGQGFDYQHCHFPMPYSSMHAHVSEIAVGTYKKAHRHSPGSHLIMIGGEGYTLMWHEEWEETFRIDWQPGTIVVPPILWFHHHFNTGDAPARDFVFHAPKYGNATNTPDLSGTGNPVKNQIQYVDEDSRVRAMYEEELRENGLQSQIPDEYYTDPTVDPDYERIEKYK